MSTPDPINVAFEACDRAGSILKKHYGRLRSVDEKFQAGLVTQADRESEDAIKAVVLKAFPDHRILGEETGLSGVKQTSPLWMIDPLDGTTNYVHRVPFFCISIGLEIDGKLAIGVVDAPILGQRYHAVAGKGAFMNGEPIRVSPRTEFREGLFATGFATGGANTNTVEKEIQLLANVILNARGIRRLGAAALDLCLVAEGVFDGFWESGLQPWDTAAGVLIAREAGAIATNFEGEFYKPEMPQILCARPEQHRHVLALMK